MIERLKELGFKFSQFSDYSIKKKVFLRHDIDIYSENVFNLATIEQKSGVSSIYFFQVDSTFYNILADEVVSSIIKINDMGHEIGLHINPHSAKTVEALREKINREYNFFKDYLPLVKTVSFHKPPEFIYEDLEFDGFINVYGNKFFKDIRYLSDSKRRELYTNLNIQLEEDIETSIQLLTHPYWWDHISLNTYEAFKRFTETKNILYKNKLKEEISPYKEYLDYRFIRENW